MYSNTSLPQEMRETSNKQPNFTPKQLEKENKNPKFSRRKKIVKIRAEINGEKWRLWQKSTKLKAGSWEDK